MLPLEVFYHVFIPPDYRASSWNTVVDEQLGAIKQSRLSDIAKVNMVVTMPAFWTSFFGISFMKKFPDNPSLKKFNGLLGIDDPIKVNFVGKLTEYINFRYPWVNILEVRDLGAPNIYEGATLQHLYGACQQRDIYCLYIHSKGIANTSNSLTAPWRQILNHYCITEWPKCVAALETNDVVGVKDVQCHKHPNMLTSGNFFWTKSSHVRQLPNPVDSHLYYDRQDGWPNGPIYRYAFERWVLSKSASCYYIVDTNTDHYEDYCFLENLIEQNLK